VRRISFDLKCPSEDSVCPITQDLIVDSCLEWNPNCSFDPKDPSKRCIKLECGHEFSAMNLMYHWARSYSVLCPVCRGGPKNARLDPKGLPSHFGMDIHNRAKVQRRRDAVELRREHEEAARQIQREVMQPDWNSILHFSANHVEMVVVRHWAVLGEDELNVGLRLPCDMHVRNSSMVFTCRPDPSTIERLGEFRIQMNITTRVTPYEVHTTKFVETDWCSLRDEEPVVNNTMVPGFGTCNYKVSREPTGGVAMRCKLPTALFCHWVREHTQSLYMRSMGLL